MVPGGPLSGPASTLYGYTSTGNQVTWHPDEPTPVNPDRPVPTLVCLHCCPKPAPPYDARAAADAALGRALQKVLQAERERAAAKPPADVPAG